jgi:hypothetical protein
MSKKRGKGTSDAGSIPAISTTTGMPRLRRGKITEQTNPQGDQCNGAKV